MRCVNVSSWDHKDVQLSQPANPLPCGFGVCSFRRNTRESQTTNARTSSDPSPPQAESGSTQPESTQPDTYERIPDHMVQALPLPDPATKPIEYEDVLQPGATPAGYYNIPKQGSGYQNVEASKAVANLGSGHYVDVGSGPYEDIPTGYELLAKKSEYENTPVETNVKVYADLKWEQNQQVWIWMKRNTKTFQHLQICLKTLNLDIWGWVHIEDFFPDKLSTKQGNNEENLLKAMNLTLTYYHQLGRFFFQLCFVFAVQLLNSKNNSPRFDATHLSIASLSATFEIENVNVASTLDTLTQKDSAWESLVFGQFCSIIV